MTSGLKKGPVMLSYTLWETAGSTSIPVEHTSPGDSNKGNALLFLPCL